MKTFLCLLCLLLCLPLMAQQQHQHHGHDRGIHFPDTDDYLTLVVDLHSHSVFSDGSVWPDIRIQEAVRDSLDGFSFTEHLEYQPHSDDIPHPDRNRAHDLGEELARPFDLMVIRGAEITRSLPPGHTNAVFIEDANKLLIDDPMEAFLETKRQGAFTFWNHPNWVAQRKDGVAELTPMHRELIDKGLLHGIEVVNDLTISKEALQVALDNDLTIMGTSDVHGLVDWQYHIHEGGHRPVTLVLAEEKTQASLKEALMAGRTVAWFENTLVGKEENLKAVVDASLSVTDAAYRGPSSVIDITIYNDSDCEYILENTSGYSLQSDLGLIELHPNASTTIQVMTLRQLASVDLKFKVLNAVTAPEERLEITLSVNADN